MGYLLRLLADFCIAILVLNIAKLYNMRNFTTVVYLFITKF